MVFLKRSITVLLVATTVSLASIFFTTKAQAADVSADKACPMTQYLVLAKSDCKLASKKPAPKSSIVSPVSALMPTPSEKEPTPTPTAYQPVQPIVEASMAQITPTATLSADVLFDMVNQHRVGIGLPTFEHDGGVCAVAESRRNEITQEIFVTHALHSGFYAKALPYWATENMIWQHTEAESLNWWLHSPVHRSAIEGSYKYACGVCNGEVCNMVFTSYEPKVAIAPSTTPAAAASTPPPVAQTTQSVSNNASKLVSNKLSTLGLKN